MPDAVRVQILATEHWSLLATRSITYNAIFSRTNIFLTVLSAAVVALALVGQATDFGDRFYVFSLLVLPVTLFIGVATYIRIIDARLQDYWPVYGMNRLRHAYLEIAPELEPNFVTGHHDDPHGIHETTAGTPRCGSTACLPAPRCSWGCSTPLSPGLLRASSQRRWAQDLRRASSLAQW